MILIKLNKNLIPILLSTLCLFSCFILSCISRTEQTTYNTNITSLKEEDFSIAAIIKDLDNAILSTEQLGNFKWKDMQEIGYWEIQQGGAACLTYKRIYMKNEAGGLYYEKDAKWISLDSILPASDQIKPLKIALQNCLNIATQIRANEVSNNKDELNRQFTSSLNTATYLCNNLYRTSNSQFQEIKLAMLEASKTTQDKYLQTFIRQSDSFVRLIKETETFLNSANQIWSKINPTE